MSNRRTIQQFRNHRNSYGGYRIVIAYDTTKQMPMIVAF